MHGMSGWQQLSLHRGQMEWIRCGIKQTEKGKLAFCVKWKYQVSRVNSVKYLELKINWTLSGKSVLESEINQWNTRLKFRYRQVGCLPEAPKKTLCQAPMKCNPGNAVSSWYSAMSQMNTKLKLKLQIIQNEMIRFKLKPRCKSTYKHRPTEHIRNVERIRAN